MTQMMIIMTNEDDADDENLDLSQGLSVKRPSCSCDEKRRGGRQNNLCHHTGCFFLTGPLPKKLKYLEPRLGESTSTYIVLDTPNLA